MKITILTLFPEMFVPLKTSILARAENKNLISIDIVNFRDFSCDKNKRVDDKPFGGGNGMLIACQPVYDAVNFVDPKHEAKRIYLSARGKTFTQAKAKKLAKEKNIVLLCGHYEGVDQRVIDMCFDEEISVGNYVLTGGEIPAMVVADCVCRLIPGVLSNKECFSCESHYSGYIEEPQYTRPQEFLGVKVPNVLTSGNHAEIEKWKKQNRKKK